MEHRGYRGTAEHDADGPRWHGRIANIAGVVTYEAAREEELESAFREAVDDYLTACRACEVEPEAPNAIRFQTILPSPSPVVQG